jgi:hypothetical protein
VIRLKLGDLGLYEKEIKMELKVVKLKISDVDIDFVVYDEIEFEKKKYVILILKEIYLAMYTSVVDLKALQRAMNIYYKYQQGGRLIYALEEDETTIQKIKDLASGS